jgi:hypothetical protein
VYKTKKRICDYCGQVFLPASNSQRYCNPKRDGRNCRAEAYGLSDETRNQQVQCERKKPGSLGNPIPVDTDRSEWQLVNPYPVGGPSPLPYVQ